MSINLVLSTCSVGYKNPYLEKLPDTQKGKLLKTVITLKETPQACLPNRQGQTSMFLKINA